MTSKPASAPDKSRALRLIRTALTVMALGALVWLGILQTNRANMLARREVSITQPRKQLKKSIEQQTPTDNQENDVSKIVGIATLVVLLGQSLIFGRQASLMRRQTDIYDRQAKLMDGQLKATERAASAARDSADAAKEGVALTRFIAERQLRAYVHISEADVSVGKDGRYSVRAKIRNSGQTPAYKHTVKIGVGIDLYPFPEERAKDSLSKAQVHLSQQALPASGSTGIEQVFPLDQRQIEAIASGKAALWLHGQSTYVDAFDNLRYTDYRQLCRGRNWRTGTFLLDTEGNDST